VAPSSNTTALREPARYVSSVLPRVSAAIIAFMLAPGTRTYKSTNGAIEGRNSMRLPEVPGVTSEPE